MYHARQKLVTPHIRNRCKQAETSRTNSTFGFFPTHKPTLKNQMRCFLPTLELNFFYNQKTLLYLLIFNKFKFSKSNLWQHLESSYENNV